MAPAVEFAEEFDHTFIDRPAHAEAECGVEPVFHIAEILVREQFQNHCRHIVGAAFAVALVPQHSPRPLRVVASPEVLNYLALNHIGKHPGAHPVASPHLAAAFALEGVNRQSADQAVVRSGARVRVECQRKIEGNVELVPEHLAPASARGKIPGVVAFPFAVQGRIDSCPYHRVEGSIAVGRQA